MMRILIIVSLVIIPLVRAYSSIATTTHVCKHQVRTLSCANDSVIYVDAARYGRMKPGDCGTSLNFAFNCSADVRRYLERKCSGRRSCSIELDAVLDKSQHGCPADLTSYLEVKHQCLRVETPRIADSSNCYGNKYPVGTVTPEGYLARVVTKETGIGSSACPWSIEARSGQTIRLRLYDFGTWQNPEKTSPAPGSGNDPHGGRPVCQVYATVSERSGSGTTQHVCGGAPVSRSLPDQGRVVYVSNSNSVQVTVTTTTDPALEQFLLKYEVMGCADPIPLPPRISVERISDRLVLKCDDGLDTAGKTWTLQCMADGNWSTPLDQVNCSTPTSGRHSKSDSGILLTVAISAAVIVAILVITCGLFCLYRRRVSKPEEESQVPLPADEYRFMPSTVPTSGYGSWALTEGGPYTPGVPVGTWAPGAQLGPWAPGLERRPSADCLERDYASTLQMRLNAMPCSSSSPSFSSAHVPLASAAGPYGLPYDPRTMMVYCPYHGTLTRVNGVDPGGARMTPGQSCEEMPLQPKGTCGDANGEDAEDGDARNQHQQPLQHQHSGLYQELDF